MAIVSPSPSESVSHFSKPATADRGRNFLIAAARMTTPAAADKATAAAVILPPAFALPSAVSGALTDASASTSIVVGPGVIGAGVTGYAVGASVAGGSVGSLATGDVVVISVYVGTSVGEIGDGVGSSVGEVSDVGDGVGSGVFDGIDIDILNDKNLKSSSRSFLINLQ